MYPQAARPSMPGYCTLNSPHENLDGRWCGAHPIIHVLNQQEVKKMNDQEKLRHCATVARNIATQENSAEWLNLSALMCWDAVAHCVLLAGLIDQDRYKAIIHLQKSDHHLLASPNDALVANVEDLTQVPPGHAICFFERKKDQWLMIHAMLTTGQAMAAGNKNGCLQNVDGGDIGRPIGWENLDLRKLTWAQGKNFVLQDGREIYVHHRPVTALA
jgi:hypothetical protein